MSAVLMEVYGRKFVHAVVAVPGIMGWICIYYADSASMIMIGRALTGLASNASLGAIIVGEYSSPENRGLFLNLKTTLVTIGYMMVHTLGHFYHWRTVALIATLPHTASLLITCTWPESPAWLASKAEYDKSQKSFYWLRGKNVKTINEIEDVVKAQKEKIRISSEMKALTLSEKVIEFFKKFGEKDFVKPVIIVVFGGILLEACGRHIFSAFAVQIVEEVTQNKAQSYYFTLGIDVVITTSAVISSILVKFCKRRTLLFSTGFSALFILYILCGYLYLESIDVFSKERTYIPIIMFILYFVLSSLGCISIPLLLLGEIFPLAHRGAGSFISSFAFDIFLTVALKIAPFLLATVKVYGTFSILGIAMGVSLTGLYFTLPETKDRTLQEIENYLNYGKYHVEYDLEAKQTEHCRLYSEGKNVECSDQNFNIFQEDALFGEIFPLAHRGSGGFVDGSLVLVILTITMQVTPYLLVNAKVYGTFAILGTVMLLSLIALWILLPETKDKTLKEIENYLNYGKYGRDDDEARLKIPKVTATPC
ncbi:facilitated trehalose transporter Tret1-like [Aricia agestis]|uniref:facilitated trehalose transporter Tret1-like n=1 Tax=Aricia agestis TaxID=91739 RepID=UPI001C205ECA|nr:facilitated trehalose transporter Tret1-like [Aricia agestis]